MPRKNGKSIAAEERRSRVIQMKMAGADERQIAAKLGVSATQVWKDVKRRLFEVRREDAEAVKEEWQLQHGRYSRLLMRWWPRSLDADDSVAGPATDKVMQILRRIDEISGIVPDKALIDMRTQNINMTGEGVSLMELAKKVALNADNGAGTGGIGGEDTDRPRILLEGDSGGEAIPEAD